jgi:hypothetical protein
LDAPLKSRVCIKAVRLRRTLLCTLRALIGARSDDVEELTEFDEGPLPADWIGELTRRGIAVRRDVLRDEARAVLKAYGELGGVAY